MCFCPKTKHGASAGFKALIIGAGVQPNEHHDHKLLTLEMVTISPIRHQAHGYMWQMSMSTSTNTTYGKLTVAQWFECLSQNRRSLLRSLARTYQKLKKRYQCDFGLRLSIQRILASLYICLNKMSVNYPELDKSEYA